MRAHFLLWLTAFLMSVSVNPALCDGVAPPAPSSKKAAMRLVMLPASIAGFCTGVVVGTPVCFVRKFKEETVNGAHGLVGSIINNDNNMFLLVPAGVAWLPAASIIAVMEAPAYAWRDAWMADKPFSKEQFSLGDLD